MQISSFYEPGSGTWTHLLADEEQKRAAIIDPVWVFDPVSGTTDLSFIDGVLDTADQAGYRIEWVLETHAHADHLTAADRIRQRTGARVACGRGICAVQQSFVKVFNLEGVPTDGSQFDRLLEDGDIIRLGRLQIRVMETPGHTGDSITYLVGDAAFVGDTLFTPAFGTARCDFPGGDAGQLYDSVCKIHGLPPETRIFLCHDYPQEGAEPVSQITVQQSLDSNVHVSNESSRAQFIAMREERDAQLSLPKLILPALQINILAGALPEADSNGVSYLRTPIDRAIADLIGRAQ